MGLFDFFGTSSRAVDTAANLVDGAVSGLDKIVYTDEERAEAYQKIIELKTKTAEKTMTVWLEAQKTILSESSIRSITRRYIAISFVATFLLLTIASCIVWPFNPEHSKHIHEILKELGTPITTIIIFYFGYYAVSNIIKAKKG